MFHVVCPGDSGGPVTKSYSGDEFLIGVIESSPKDCDPRGTMYFTSIPYHIQWIKNITKLTYHIHKLDEKRPLDLDIVY